MKLLQSKPQFSEEIERGHFVLVRFYSGSQTARKGQVKGDQLGVFLPTIVHYVKPFGLGLVCPLTSNNFEVSVEDVLEEHAQVFDLNLLTDEDFLKAANRYGGVGIYSKNMNPILYPEGYRDSWKKEDKEEGEELDS